MVVFNDSSSLVNCKLELLHISEVARLSTAYWSLKFKNCLKFEYKLLWNVVTPFIMPPLRLQPHFLCFSNKQLLIWLNAKQVLPLSWQNTPPTYISFCSFSNILQSLKVENFLRMSKNLKMRGFAHLGKAFENDLGMISNL